MNNNEPHEILFRITELSDDPGNWMITRVEPDGTELGKVLRRPDGTFWEVKAVHFFPPAGGNYRIELGAQITDSDIIKVLESSYVDAMRQAVGDSGTPTSAKAVL